MYGYQIAKRLERFGDGVLSGKQSALYPVLRNLGAAGLLDSHVEPSMSGPPRRYYRITVTGRAVLHAWSAAWRATRDSVDAVLREPAPSPPCSPPPSLATFTTSADRLRATPPPSSSTPHQT